VQEPDTRNHTVKDGAVWGVWTWESGFCSISNGWAMLFAGLRILSTKIQGSSRTYSSDASE
jgi:hypothetical protein